MPAWSQESAEPFPVPQTNSQIGGFPLPTSLPLKGYKCLHMARQSSRLGPAQLLLANPHRGSQGVAWGPEVTKNPLSDFFPYYVGASEALQFNQCCSQPLIPLHHLPLEQLLLTSCHASSNGAQPHDTCATVCLLEKQPLTKSPKLQGTPASKHNPSCKCLVLQQPLLFHPTQLS